MDVRHSVDTTRRTMRNFSRASERGAKKFEIDPHLAAALRKTKYTIERSSGELIARAEASALESRRRRGVFDRPHLELKRRKGRHNHVAYVKWLLDYRYFGEIRIFAPGDHEVDTFMMSIRASQVNDPDCELMRITNANQHNTSEGAFSPLKREGTKG